MVVLGAWNTTYVEDGLGFVFSGLCVAFAERDELFR